MFNEILEKVKEKSRITGIFLPYSKTKKSTKNERELVRFSGKHPTIFKKDSFCEVWLAFKLKIKQKFEGAA